MEDVLPTLNQISTAVRTRHLQHPTNFPRGETGRAFLQTLLQIQLNNGEKIIRDWLVWSVLSNNHFSVSAVTCFTMVQSNHDHN